MDAGRLSAMSRILTFNAVGILIVCSQEFDTNARLTRRSLAEAFYAKQAVGYQKTWHDDQRRLGTITDEVRLSQQSTVLTKTASQAEGNS